MKGGKLENPEKKLSEQGKNQQETQPTYDAEGPLVESPGNISGP